MRYFVFRNNTVERFFPKDYLFSGYDDISVVPAECDGYVWFYQAPVKYDRKALAEEIKGYERKVEYVAGMIERTKQMVALTMDILYSVPYTDDDCSVQTAVAEYNLALYGLARKYPNVKVIDFTEFTRDHSASELFDWKFYFISQAGMNPKLSRDFASWWGKKMDSIAFRRKKCLVLDLDNTLWGGVLGEDGATGIKIGGDYPGKAFFHFQQALLELSRHGVILSVCSKNNEQDVLEAWEKSPFMVLRKESFAAARINWNDKAGNIKELAEELNIGLDSMVFIDDSPQERELVRQMLPMVAVPEFPEQPYELPIFFKRLVDDFFKIYSVTAEDLKKTEQYKANAARSRAKSSFSDLSGFLESLGLHLSLYAADEFNIPRIAQMTQKTNQFNLTTRRYSDSDIRGFASSGWKIWCLSVSDKFGDNGVVAISIGEMKGDICELILWLMSCRVLKRDMEFAMMDEIVAAAVAKGAKTIRGFYYPTAKNGMVREFYKIQGFDKISEDEKGNAVWELDVSNGYENKNHHIEVNNEQR